VAVVALNQPQHRNALTRELATALRHEVARASADSSLRALVVTGTGVAFCAGADLGSLGSGAVTPDAKRQVLSDYYRAFLDLRDLPVPTIAAVNGPAIGAGLNLAMCCDLRVLAEDARLAAPFVRLEMLLLGQPIDAHRALLLGLANRIVPPQQLEDAALEWARALAALPRPVLVRLKRTLLLAETGASLDAVLAFETAAQAETLGSEDAREGWSALRERRAPQFHDR
jgi:enoyl-CoA hydratase